MTFDPAKPVQTRDGLPARIICINARGDLPLIALVKFPNGSEEVRWFAEDGSYNSADPQSRRDLINVPEKRTLDLWLNINSYGNIIVGFTSVDQANRNAAPDRVSCVHIMHEYTVGEGMP